MLHINDLTYRIAGRVLFDQATAVVPAGHKVGLVGRNGTGKTTLFRLILGELQSDSGAVHVHPRASVGTVEQEAPAGNISLIDTVLAADKERAALLIEADTASDPGRIGEIHTRLADIDAHTAPARAATILAGLGFDEAQQQRPVSKFSGGWRMRVALAAALFRSPDLLLLDEPTNHLDLEAALWLESYLRNWRGTLLLISHERNFLNAVCEEIIHVEATKLNRYVGNYDRFERTRRERQERDAKMRNKQLAQRRHIESFINRFRAKASKATQAQSRIKMLERMEPIASVVEERTIAFNFPTPDPLSPPLMVMDGASVGYEADNPVLKNLDLRIDMDDRIGLLGANGNGKSTLVKLISDRLKPMHGRLQKSSKLKVGYFAQHQLEELSPGGSPLSHLQALQPMEPERRVRAQLGRFGFEGERSDTSVEKLSGGEKARLLFALMSRDAPHILVLDEPTNHLDVDAREALVHALNAYEGAVILVSHDAHLVGAVCDRLWLVARGRCEEYHGDVEEYRRSLLEPAARKDRGERKSSSPASELPPQANPKVDRRARAEARAETAGLRRVISRAERELEKLNAAFDEVREALAEPSVYEAESRDRLIDLQTRYSEIERDIERTEEAWMTASHALELAMSRLEA
ncbi:MAG: ABC-F family ATP-binding cassette domain-containing protein [Rhodospirillales bacterium]